jgi:hypothetical protein
MGRSIALFLRVHFTVFNSGLEQLYSAATPHRIVSSRDAKPASNFAWPLGYSFANSPITSLALNK